VDAVLEGMRALLMFKVCLKRGQLVHNHARLLVATGIFSRRPQLVQRGADCCSRKRLKTTRSYAGCIC